LHNQVINTKLTRGDKGDSKKVNLLEVSAKNSFWKKNKRKEKKEIQ
jgi:hypothetical protein